MVRVTPARGVRVELAEDVAHVRFDRFRAELQLRGDLAVGAAVDDELGDLEFSLGERVEAMAARGTQTSSDDRVVENQ